MASPSKNTPPTAAEIAAHFPELEVLEMIGVGGMGAVYKARQPKLDRLVALKILSSDLAGDPAFAERFDREARVLARLSHPNIVTVFDTGMAGPFAYLMMEHVDGVNLRQAMKAGRFTPVDALSLVQDVCGALKFAHEKGILHRDIKPENILIDSRGLVKIADFGIAKLVGENDREQVTLTQHGFVLGSPHYMAPEQFESPGDVDQRADIFSLGVVLYELLTGELPLGRFAPPSKKSAVDARIDEIVMRTLERERELRFQTVGEVKTQMEAAKDAKPTTVQTTAGDQRPKSVGVIARHATAAAVCTGVSLLLVPVLFWLLKPTAPIPASQPGLVESSNAGAPMFALLAMVLAVVTPLIGIGLGISALRDIRESGGQRRGFYRSMLGTLTWPVVFILGAAGVLMVSLFEMTGSRNDLLFLVLTLLLGAPFAVLLVYLVARWVKGETRLKVTEVEETRPLARFATASALLGGVSVVLAAGSIIYWIVVSVMSQMHPIIPGSFPLILGVSSLVTGIPAVLAMVLGTKALSEVRQSGGRKAGKTRAWFGIVVLPIVFVGVLCAWALIPTPKYDERGRESSLPSETRLNSGRSR